MNEMSEFQTQLVIIHVVVDVLTFDASLEASFELRRLRPVKCCLSHSSHLSASRVTAIKLQHS